jgi:hypothetical protein
VESLARRGAFGPSWLGRNGECGGEQLEVPGAGVIPERVVLAGVLAATAAGTVAGGAAPGYIEAGNVAARVAGEAVFLMSP